MSPVIGKYFPSQKSKEKVYLLLRRHWFTYVIFLLITILMSIPLVGLMVFWFINPDVFEGIVINILVVLVPAYGLTILALLLYGFIDYYLDVYIVTNQRIVDIKQNGFFKREIAELHLHQVQDVSAKVKGIFPTLMHYGDIYIQTAGEKDNFMFKSVPHPYRVSKIIVNLHESHIEQRLKEFEEIISEGDPADAYKEQRGIKRKTKNNQATETIGDISGIDRKVFSKARRNTKKMLKESVDGSKGEKEGMDVSEELSAEEKRRILHDLNRDEKRAEASSDIDLRMVGGEKPKTEALKDNSELSSDFTDKNSESSINSEIRHKKKTENKSIEADRMNTNSNEIGEMHENEEIDI